MAFSVQLSARSEKQYHNNSNEDPLALKNNSIIIVTRIIIMIIIVVCYVYLSARYLSLTVQNLTKSSLGEAGNIVKNITEISNH